MSDTSPLPLDPTDPRARPVPRPDAARDARHLGATADRPTTDDRRPRAPLVPTYDPYAAYGVRDEPTARPEDAVDPDDVVTLRRRRVHRPTDEDPYRIGYAGTTGLLVLLGVGVLALLLLLVWVNGG